MSTEKPFEYFSGKYKRLRSLDVFADAVKVEQKRKFPISLKIRYDFLHDQQENLDEIVRKTFKKLIGPTLYDIIRIFQSSQQGDNYEDNLFVPTVCLNLSEIFVDSNEILTHIEQEIGKFTDYCVRLDSNFINSVKDAVLRVFYCLGGRKSDSNFDGTVQELNEFYSKLKTKSTVFITFSDFFVFDYNVVNDILHIFSSNLQNLPVFFLIPVLICGPRALNSFVSRQILKKFDVKTVDTAPARKFLDEFFVSAFSNDEFVLHFNDKTSLNLLNSQFSENFHSLKRFIDGIKLLLLDHFCEEIFAVFSCPSTCLDQVFDRISSELDNFSPEFRHSPMKSPKKKLKILYARRVVDDLRRNFFKFNDFRKNFWLVLRCFQTLLSSLPEPKPTTELECFVKLLDPEFFTSENWKEILVSVGSFEVDDIEKFLTECNNIFDQTHDIRSTSEFAEFVDEQTKIFQTLDEFQKQLNEEREHLADDENVTSTNGKRFLLVDLKRNLRSQIRQNKETGAFIIRKKEFQQQLCQKFVACSKFSPTEIDVRRAFCLPGDAVLRRFFIPSTRNCLHRALLEPDFSFNKEKAKRIQLDCCHIFELYKLSGATIFTKNMLKSFFAFCRTMKKSNQDTDEEFVRARFYKVLAEFEYLGLIKFVPRKKQKIAKLVFFVPSAD